MMDAESQLLAEKDAEIERLRGELEASRNLCQVWIDKSARQDQIITELCDALEECETAADFLGIGQERHSLIQRALEATK
jgi:uncharacterized coiled-coil protein SlyX